MIHERIEATEEEPLPNGGKYAVVRYEGADGLPATKATATKAEVIEYSADDRPISLTTMRLGNGSGSDRAEDSDRDSAE
jgi:hypothetical protein